MHMAYINIYCWWNNIWSNWVIDTFVIQNITVKIMTKLLYLLIIVFKSKCFVIKKIEFEKSYCVYIGIINLYSK